MPVYKVRLAQVSVGHALVKEHSAVDILNKRPGQGEGISAYVKADQIDVTPNGTLIFLDGRVLLALPPGEWLGVVRTDSETTP